MQQLMFKLDQNPKGRGLRCDGDGLFLGRDALLRKNDDGNFEARPDVELQKTLSHTYGGETTWESHRRPRRHVLAGTCQRNKRFAVRVGRGDLQSSRRYQPLQEVTFEFMQRTTNAAYDEAIELYNAGKFKVRLSPQEAIGNYVDDAVRIRLGLFLDGLEIPTDSESTIRVNRRAYNSSGSSVSDRLPDIRVGNFAFDVSLRAKQASDPQIKGFFNADFKPIGVVIVRPNQLGNASSYIIWRAKGD
jgi:hypothetical protein